MAHHQMIFLQTLASLPKAQLHMAQSLLVVLAEAEDGGELVEAEVLPVEGRAAVKDQLVTLGNPGTSGTRGRRWT